MAPGAEAAWDKRLHPLLSPRDYKLDLRFNSEHIAHASLRLRSLPQSSKNNSWIIKQLDPSRLKYKFADNISFDRPPVLGDHLLLQPGSRKLFRVVHLSTSFFKMQLSHKPFRPTMRIDVYNQVYMQLRQHEGHFWRENETQQHKTQ